MAAASGRDRRLRLATSTGVLLLLAALGAAVYLPGLPGSFLFDDFASLPALGRYGPITDLPGLLRYLTSGIADPTGRPVAMLSFLIDANHWPADPWPFKRTNLVIHLINGSLLYLLLHRLGETAGLSRAKVLPAAALGSAMWLLHPLWVSSVLYVIQRQALLATSFVLLGMLVWLVSQSAFEKGQARRGWALAAISVLICGLLAGLSKPNGFLLPLLLLSLRSCGLDAPRATVLSATPSRTRAARLLLIVPSLVLVASLLFLSAHADTQLRPWSISQRLLTEPRVITDYLRLLMLPTAYSSGVFSDWVTVSRDLMHPACTLPAMLLVLGTFALALLSRRRHPTVAAAVLFYFAGHLVESSVLPLELHFEHRNYLPSLLMFWPVAIWLTADAHLRFGRRFAGGALIALLALTTLARASLWGQPLDLALSWARDYPGSPRAQTHAALQLSSYGQPEMAARHLAPLLQQRPQELQYALTLLDAQCLRGAVEPQLLLSLAKAMEPEGIGADISNDWLQGVLRRSASAACRNLDPRHLQVVLATVRDHPRRSPEISSRLARIDGFLALRQGQCAPALDAFNRQLDAYRRPEAAIEQSGLLASTCGPTLGLRHLQHYQAGSSQGDAPPRFPMLRLRDAVMRHQGYWAHELDRIRGMLEQDAAAAASTHEETAVPQVIRRK